MLLFDTGKILGLFSWLSASLQPSHHGSKVADSADSGLVAESSKKWMW